MKRHRCRGCGGDSLRLLHDFGAQPLAGNFPLVPESQSSVNRYPLDLSCCDRCGLLQVTHLPPIHEIFHANYRYASSTVPGLVRHFEAYADWLESHVRAGSEVLEIGCNDGVLLTLLQAKGFACHGVDASRNVVELARSKGLSVDEAFFG
ncbi:methionine biosynthesis protein MetW, partial [Leptospira sp. SA-E8]|uniref:methionine biosynthesis protein MetW n=1 Tax=Leptospira sp. SA-E8 TaxID=3422259 RepID=UPI003EBDDF06